MTSQDVSVLFPQFMYESILKVANDDPEFEFKVRSTPYPVKKLEQNDTASKEVGFIIFIIAIAYSLILSIFAAEIVEERTSKLKHF